MNAENEYIRAERVNIEKTLRLLQGLTCSEDLSEYEVIAQGKLLQDIYLGIERILRRLLEIRCVKIDKTSNWHKDLLLKARSEALITSEQFDSFLDLLLFRHVQVHGYGFNLDPQRLQQLAAPLPDLCKDFFRTLDV